MLGCLLVALLPSACLAAGGHLSFSAPVTIAGGCWEPGKKPGDDPRSSCSSDVVYGLRRMGSDLLAGPNGTMIRSVDGGAHWAPIKTDPDWTGLEGHAYYWNAQPDTLWMQYVDKPGQASHATAPTTEMHSGSHRAISLDPKTSEVVLSTVQHETSFSGMPPVCYFYMYGCTNFVKLKGHWFTVKAVNFVGDDHDQHSKHACLNSSTFSVSAEQAGAGRAGQGSAPPGGLNLSTVLFNSTDGHSWQYMSTIMDTQDFPESTEGPNESGTTAVRFKHTSIYDCASAKGVLTSDVVDVPDSMCGCARAGLAVLGGKLIVVSRMDGGDGTCNEYNSYCEKQPWWHGGASHLPHLSNYRITSSTDGGWHWSTARRMVDTEGQAIGCARPKLLALGAPPDQAGATAPLLLAGGRPSMNLWLSVDGASSWANYNIALIHNSLEPNVRPIVLSQHSCNNILRTNDTGSLTTRSWLRAEQTALLPGNCQRARSEQHRLLLPSTEWRLQLAAATV